MKTLIFLRHGDTEYEEKFPDLTEKGKDQALEAALYIKEIAEEEEPGNIHLVSSTRQRARGVASIIEAHLKCERLPDEPLIRDMDLYDREVALKYWRSLGDPVTAAKMYIKDPWFETGEFVEKRSDVVGRSACYLSLLFNQYEDGSLPDLSIHVCHMEVLWKLVEKLNFEEPVGYCEPIVIRISGEGRWLTIRTYYRNSALSYEAKSIYEFFGRQFN